jgi:hypothetical protein
MVTIIKMNLLPSFNSSITNYLVMVSRHIFLVLVFVHTAVSNDKYFVSVFLIHEY